MHANLQAENLPGACREAAAAESHRIGLPVEDTLIPYAIRLTGVLGEAGIAINVSVLAEHRIEDL